jgi:hypothetical protein
VLRGTSISFSSKKRATTAMIGRDPSSDYKVFFRPRPAPCIMHHDPPAAHIPPLTSAGETSREQTPSGSIRLATGIASDCLKGFMRPSMPDFIVIVGIMTFPAPIQSPNLAGRRRFQGYL